MPDRNLVIRVVHEWVEKAEQDLEAASHLLELGEKGPTDVICFHAQQCVEKYLKALLVFENLPVPKTHDIERLLNLVPNPDRIPLTPEQMRILTGYATETRYPGYDRIPFSEAKDTVELSCSIRKEVRTMLPTAGLTRSEE